MDKMQEIKQNVFKIAYGIAKDCVPFPENIKICPAYTSNSLDGCITESGKVLKNDKKKFSVFIRYGRYCVCMVRFEAYILKPIQLEVMKCERTKNGKHETETIKISSIAEIKKHSQKICLFLKNAVE